MAVITLLTDFSDRDYYVSMFKGDLLTTCPSVQIVDISHAVPAYDINTAAFLLRNTYQHFPKNTIHIVRVYEKGVENQQLLAMKYKGYYFIAPDNGVLPLAFDEKPDLIIKVDSRQSAALNEYYCKVVREIVFNNNIGSIGMATNDYVEIRNIMPVLEQDNIKGQAIYIDSFGNIVTNIRREDLERYDFTNTPFRIQYRKSDYIDKFVKNYADVPQGYALARFNALDYVEIGIHCGNASQLLGIEIGSLIKIWIE